MDQAYVIQQLAQHLPDDMLQQIFPDTRPQTVRALLLDKDLLPSEKKEGKKNTEAKTQRKVLGRCKVFSDGASRGNPGLAGAGVVLYDDQGKELCAKTDFLGQCTNNVAEYRALILGLQTAQERGCQSLELFLDSELVVRQMRGQYKVKNKTLKPLFSEAQKLLEEFGQYTISHIPRALNKRADELANQAIDTRNTG